MIEHDFGGGNCKVALVTGGTSGIGKAIVQRFAENGIKTVCVGRDIAKVMHLSNEFSNIDAYTANLADIQEIKKLASYIRSEYGKLDILVNNAGIWHTHKLDEITFDEYDLVFRTNVASVMFMTQQFIDLLGRNKGNIVNISSIGGLQSHIAGKSQYVYASSKAAVIQFSQLCALNYAKEVRVNCICPGPTDTPIFLNRNFSWVKEQIPMGYMGQSEDVAELVLFISSDKAKYITGAVIPVDGGSSIV